MSELQHGILDWLALPLAFTLGWGLRGMVDRRKVRLALNDMLQRSAERLARRHGRFPSRRSGGDGAEA